MVGRRGEIEQGQIRWVERLDEKRRPGLIVTRSVSIRVLSDLLVIPLTTRIRGLPTEIDLGVDDGLPMASVANAQRIESVPKSLMGPLIATIDRGRWHEVCTAVALSIDC